MFCVNLTLVYVCSLFLETFMFSMVSDRPNLKEPKKIEEIQEVYTSALQAYIDTHRPKLRTVFARLLMKLTDLRSLSSDHADTLFAFKLDNNLSATLEHPVKQEYFEYQNHGHGNLHHYLPPPPLSHAPVVPHFAPHPTVAYGEVPIKIEPPQTPAPIDFSQTTINGMKSPSPHFPFFFPHDTLADETLN